MNRHLNSLLPLPFDRLGAWWYVIILVLIALCLKWPVILLLITLVAWRAWEMHLTFQMVRQLTESDPSDDSSKPFPN